MKKIISLTFAAALAMAFVGCDTMRETNTNKAVVVNSTTNANAVVNSNMMNSNAMMNSNTMSNRPLTREEYDRDRERYEREAKASGRTVGTGANDAWLWTKTKTALATTDDLRDSTINVDVSNAVITLTGTVGTKEQQQMAVKVANEIEGKTRVQNNLKVQPNDSMTNQMTGGNSTTTNANRRP